MTRDEMRKRLDDLVAEFAGALVEWCDGERMEDLEPLGDDLTDRILALLPEMLKLEWRDDDCLYLGNMSCGSVWEPFDGNGYMAETGDDDLLDKDLFETEDAARAAVEMAVKEALGWKD